MKRLLTAMLLTAGFAVALQAQETRLFTLSGFHTVKNSTSANIEIYQSPEFKVEVTAQSHVFDMLELTSTDGVLKIGSKENRLLGKSWGRVLVRIWMPKINGIGINGSGNVLTQNPFETEVLVLDINGSGNIRLKDVKGTRIDARINGSGSITVDGKSQATELEVHSSGSGNFNLENLCVSRALVTLNGSGSAGICCISECNGKINGRGNIKLKGNPRIDVKVNGYGRFIQM